MMIRIMDIPYATCASGRRTVMCSMSFYRYYQHNQSGKICGDSISSVELKPNDIIETPMCIEYAKGKGRDVMIKSLVDNTYYPIFHSEYVKVINNCIIEKGKIYKSKWAMRSHGGLFSIMLVG